MRRLQLVPMTLLLLAVYGCGCEGMEPEEPSGPVTGVWQADWLTMRFDQDGVGQGLAIDRDKLLEFAEKLGFYDSKTARLAQSTSDLLSLTVGQEEWLGVGHLYICLISLDQDAASGTITATIEVRLRDENGVLLNKGTLVFSFAGVNPVENSLGSFTVVVMDAAGNIVFSEEITAEFRPVPENRAPVALATATPNPAIGLQVVTLSAGGSADPDGDVMTYSWAQSSGDPVTLSGSAIQRATFTAPDVAAETVLTFTVTVSDGQLASTSSVSVTINRANHAPLALAGDDQVVLPGDTVTLDGSGSSDSDGDVLSYTWTQLGSPQVTLDNESGATPTFQAPHVTAATILEFQLTVSDGVLTATDVVRVVISQASLFTLIPKSVNMVATAKDLGAFVSQIDEWAQIPGGIAAGMGLDQLPAGTLNCAGAFFIEEEADLEAAVLDMTLAEFVSMVTSLEATSPVPVAISTDDAGNGITRIISTYTSESEPSYTSELFAVESKDYLVISPTKASLQAILASTASMLTEMDANWLKAYNDGKLVVYVTPEEDLPYFYLPISFSDSEAICLAVGLGDSGVLTFWNRYKSGSEGLTAMQQWRESSGAPLIGLPDEPILLASGNLPSYMMPDLVTVLMMLNSYGGGSLERLQALQALNPVVATSLSELAGGDAGMIGLAEVHTVANADEFIAVIEAYIADLNADLLFSEPITITENTTQLSRPFKEIQLNVIPEQYNGLATMALGSEPLLLRLAKISPTQVVISMGGGVSRFSAIVDAAAAGSAPLADRPSVAAASALLPEQRTIELYLAPVQFTKLFYDFNVATDALSEGMTDPGHATSAISISVSREGNSARFDIAGTQADLTMLLEVAGFLY